MLSQPIDAVAASVHMDASGRALVRPDAVDLPPTISIDLTAYLRLVGTPD
ncbi:hypothetical protein GCM10022381_39020 [Leifsonia kafniensis]|uniref:Uncharacterized protein n=1 Tax=Leifsonia kafniensis TaxID=475957 RepID=A0ABP7L1Z7_9MICO